MSRAILGGVLRQVLKVRQEKVRTNKVDLKTRIHEIKKTVLVLRMWGQQ